MMSAKNEQPNLNEIELNDLAPADEEIDETKGGEGGIGQGITPHWQVEKLRSRPW